MNICFVTAGPIEWASSRLRAFWVAEELEKRGHDVRIETYERVTESGLFTGSDAVIWQKLASPKIIQWHQAHHKHQAHYWDVCDPSWWFQPNECQEIAAHMAGVVASSQPLADDFNEWLGQEMAVCIRDRFKLSHFHAQRQHRDVSPVRLIWFGIAANRIALWAAKAPLERLVANGYKIELTILDDRPDVPFRFSDAFPIYHTQWTLGSEVEVIASHDIALLPPYPGPWGQVKSNNKNMTANLCGLPDADGLDYSFILRLFTGASFRALSSQVGTGALKNYNVGKSAAEWEQLLCS